MDLLKAGLQQLEGEASERVLEAFLLYRTELLEWNTRFNLTAIRDPEEVLTRHFLDSLSLLKVAGAQSTSLLDIGTGAGFPGLPLKIVRPDWQVTLLEATGKRVTFLKHMADVLGIKQGLEIVQGRAEEIARKPEYRAHFHVVTARAVASLPVLLEYATPFTHPGGLLIFPKKGELKDEIMQGKAAARVLGCRFREEVLVDLPGLQDGRQLLVWSQERRCPDQYPRSGSAIAKKPLA
jgi:16S rRNA (guanine527-N7)-methyltransferase